MCVTVVYLPVGPAIRHEPGANMCTVMPIGTTMVHVGVHGVHSDMHAVQCGSVVNQFEHHGAHFALAQVNCQQAPLWCSCSSSGPILTLVATMDHHFASCVSQYRQWLVQVYSFGADATAAAQWCCGTDSCAHVRAGVSFYLHLCATDATLLYCCLHMGQW